MKTNYDLIVTGGGFSGVCAAIAAARQGLDVLLVEKWNCLGGAAVGNLVNPFMCYWTFDPESKEKKRLNNGIFKEITDALEQNQGMIQRPDGDRVFDEEILKLVLNRMVAEAGVQLLFHAVVSEACVEDGNIRSVTCATRSGAIRFTARYFIDATGDGELSMLAGCLFHVGREEDNLCQPMTLCFRMGNVDQEKYFQNRASINRLYQQFQRDGKIKNPREDVLVFRNLNDGVLHFNSTRVVRKNPTDPFDVTLAEIEAREQVFELHRFLKENVEGFEQCRVLSTAMQIGTRESRMIEGEYCLSKEDLIALTKFEDGIAVSNYDIDIHNPEGTGTSHYYFKHGEWYTIPYRCLIPLGIKNMLVAGRCISSTHEAQASYRIMPVVANIGEAAGVAIGIAAAQNADTRSVDVAVVRQILRDGGAVL